MNAVDSKLNYFISKMNDLKTKEREYKAMNEVVGAEFSDWLKQEGLPENFTFPEMILHFRRKSAIEV